MKHVRRHLIFFLFIVSVAAFLSIFCATYPFWKGVFFQVTPVLICSHLFSFMIGIVFVVLLLIKDRILLSAFLSPVSLVLLFFVCWGIVVSFVSKTPLLSFLGHSAIGEGAITFVDFYIHFIAFLYLSRLSKYKKRIPLIFIGVCFVIFFIQITTEKNSPFRPYWYSEYLGFYALCLIFILWIYNQLTTIKYIIVGGGLCVALLFLAHNKAAFLAILGVAPSYYMFYQVKTVQDHKFSYAFLFVFLIPLLMPFLVKIFISIGYFQEHYEYIVSSLFWRDQSNQVIMRDMLLHPLGLFIGNGWGHFEDLVKAYFTEGLFHGWRKISLEEIKRTTFHSHHFIFELLYATGFIGIVLFVNFLLVLVVKVKRNVFLPFTCFIISFLTLSSFWFIVPSIYPLLAAACAGAVQFNYKKWKYERLLCLSIVFFFSSILIWAIIVRCFFDR